MGHAQTVKYRRCMQQQDIGCKQGLFPNRNFRFGRILTECSSLRPRCQTYLSPLTFDRPPPGGSCPAHESVDLIGSKSGEHYSHFALGCKIYFAVELPRTSLIVLMTHMIGNSQELVTDSEG